MFISLLVLVFPRDEFAHFAWNKAIATKESEMGVIICIGRANWRCERGKIENVGLQ